MDSEEILKQLSQYQGHLFTRKDGVVIPASPSVLSANLLPIRQLLILLVDKVYESELAYRKAKAAKYDELMTSHKPGEKPMSKSAAEDAVDRDMAVVELKVGTERLRNFMKYTDGLCTSIQSVLRVQAGSEKNNY
jgi:hypothetical protein